MSDKDHERFCHLCRDMHGEVDNLHDHAVVHSPFCDRCWPEATRAVARSSGFGAKPHGKVRSQPVESGAKRKHSQPKPLSLK